MRFRTLTRCLACGFTEIRTDEVVDRGVVLLAGARRSNPEIDGADALNGLSLERIDHALALHRQTGLPIVVSGGSVKGDTATLAELGADWLQRRTGVTALAVEGASRDTWENAAFSADIMEKQGLGRVLLVTHAFHMPRAMLSVPLPFGVASPSTTAPTCAWSTVGPTSAAATTSLAARSPALWCPTASAGARAPTRPRRSP